MPSLYSVLKKSVPYCERHQGMQALYYNVEELMFLCDRCMEEENGGKCADDGEKKLHAMMRQRIGGSHNNLNTFPLQQIIQNPVLLMLKHQFSSFLSKLDPPSSSSSFYNSNYRVPEYRKILTDIDHFIKTKKHTQEFTQQFFKKLRDQVNARIDCVLGVLEENERMIIELQQKTLQLKGIKKAYANQFLETLQTSFTNGTQSQLKELLKKYSVQNENPFRKIDQIVNEITERVGKFKEVNWQHVMGMERRLLDGYIWRKDRIFLNELQGQQGKGQEMRREQQQQSKQLYSLKQQNTILPYGESHKLQQWSSDNKENDQLYYQEHNNDNTFPQQLYISCIPKQIQLLTTTIGSNITKFIKHQDSLSSDCDKQQSIEYQQECQFNVIDKYECQQQLRNGGNRGMGIDIMYELPQQRLLTICYQGLGVYSYQMNKLKKIASISTIKGTSQLLVFEHYCLVLTTNDLYQINYHQLNRPVNLRVSKMEQNQTIQSMEYLYINRRKIENEVLLNVWNHRQKCKRQLRLNLNQCHN